LDYEETELPDGCVYGDPESETQVVLVGDSHAAQWFPALHAIAEEQDWRLLNRTKSACTPVLLPVASDQHDGEYTECRDWKAAVYDELDRIEPDLVILSTSDAAEIMGHLEETAVDEWREGWEATVDRVSAASGATVVLTDTPRATDGPAPDCLSLNMDSPQDCLDG